MVGEQAESVAEVLAVDLEDLQLAEQEVGQGDCGRRAVEPASQVQPMGHRQSIDNDVDRPLAVWCPEVQAGLAVQAAEELVGQSTSDQWLFPAQ